MSEYNPYNERQPVGKAALFSSRSLDAIKDSFVAESSFAQMWNSFNGQDNYSLIKNQLLEFRGMDDQGDRESYDPYQDPVVMAQPIESLPILGNVQTVEERDLVLQMLMDQQADVEYRMSAGLFPNIIGGIGGGMAGFTGIASGAFLGPNIAKAIGGAVLSSSLDEAVLLGSQPTRTLEQAQTDIVATTAFSTAFSLGVKAFQSFKTTSGHPYTLKFGDDFATQTERMTGELGNASKRPFTREALDEDFFEETAKPRSAGSAATPDQFRIMPEDEPYITLGNVGKEFNANFNKNYGEKLSSAWGLEKLPDTPVKRILMGESNYLRQMVGHLVEHPYFQLKNFNGTASSVGIDRVVNSRWLGQSLVPAMRETEAIYKTYRERTGLEAEKGFLRQKGMDMIKGRGEFLSPDEFLEEVSKAKRRIGSAEEADMIPEVLQAASLWDKKIFKPLAEEAKSLQMFSILPRRELARTRREVSIKTSALNKATPDNKIKIKEEIDLLNVKVQDLQKQIIDADNLDIRETFVNRLYRRDYMDTPDGKKAWYEVLAKHGYSKQEAEGFRIGILGEVPYSKIETDPVGLARSLRERTLADIPDTALEPFLESNMFALGRYYAMRMGTDVELVRKFGSVDLLPHFENIKAEFKLKRSALMLKNTDFFHGKSSAKKMYRGTGGKSKVNVERNAFGDGDYFASTQKTAKLFGKDVNQINVRLNKPFVIKSDADLDKAFKKYGIDTIELNQKTKRMDELADEINRVKKEYKAKGKSPKLIAEFIKVTEKQSKEFLKLLPETQNIRRSLFNKLRESIEKDGFDGAVFEFGVKDFLTATKGKLTLSKAIKENKLSRETGSPILHTQFSHDQVITFSRNIAKDEGIAQETLTLAQLNKAEKQAIEDLTVLRDRMRGTYGLPDNPDSWTNRGMRMARGFNAMTMLTGALAAVPDVARIAMHSGMKNMFGTMFEALADNMKLAKLGKYETNLTGEALDDYLSLRAALFADLADSISVRHPMEKAMGEATQMFFNVSLMNQWNVAVKTMAGLVAGSRMIDDIAILAKGKGKDLERARTRLARSGIGLTDAKLINAELSNHMLKGRKYVKIARTQLWENTKVAELFRAALGKEVNTIIVTPGLGDLPNTIGGGLKNMFPQNVRKSAREFSDSIENPTFKKGADAVEGIFVSPELSRLIFQFKSFGIAATQRILIPGLQHTDKSVLTGAVMLIGLGVLVDQLRRNQNDINIPQSGGDMLMSGIERSGILGYFSDVGRAIENFSHPISRPGRFFEQLGGPFVHQIRDASDVLYDYSGLGNINKTTNRHARDLMYLSNVAHFDWLMDGAERGLNYLTVGKN